MVQSLPSLPQPVLVTGGAGFIGRHLVTRLLELGSQVTVFDLPGVKLPPSWEGKVRQVEGDIGVEADVHKAIAGAGFVFHTAAVVSDWAPAEAYERITLQGSRYVFDEAVRSGVGVQLLSSFAVYGDAIRRGIEMDEDTPFGQPMGIYGRYKQAQEAMAWRYYSEHGLRLSVVRPTKVYGPGSRPWLHEVAKALLSGKPILINGGDFNPALVYIDDLVDILLLAASLPQAQGRAYNGFAGSTVTWRQYCTDLAAIIGAPPPRVMPGWLSWLIATFSPPLWRLLGKQTRPLMTPDSRRVLMTDYRIATQRIREELGWQPRLDYDQSLQAIADYWRDPANRV